MKVDLSPGTTGELIPDRIFQCAERHPDSPAVSCGSDSMSYRELAGAIIDQVEQLGREGVEAGDRVAILAENSAQHVVAFLSIVSMGGSVVSLPAMQTPGAIALLIEDSAACLVMTTPAMRGLFEDALAELHGKVPRSCLIGHQSVAGTNARHRIPRATCFPEQEFNVVYSSGTTGTPKGIVHSHRSRASLASGFAGLGFDASSVTLVSTPLYTNMSIPAFLGTFWGGGEVVIVDKFEESVFFRIAREKSVTHFFLVPTQADRLVTHGDFDPAHLQASRLKYVAGSKLKRSTKESLLHRWPGEFVEVYGMTEGAPYTVLCASQFPDKLESVGQSPDGAELLIVNDDDSVAETGCRGEVVGYSSAMMSGYNNRPDADAELRWLHPDGREFFRSGDIGYLDDDGFLFIVDRKKDVIISGGYNIYSQDLEAALEQSDAVEEAAVIAVPDERWGETPVAFVVLANPDGNDLQSILDDTNARLGRFQKITRIHRRDSLPRNALGKVVKAELIEFPENPPAAPDTVISKGFAGETGAIAE